MEIGHCVGLLENYSPSPYFALTEDDIILLDTWSVEINGSVRSSCSLIHRCPCRRTSNVAPRQPGRYGVVCAGWLGSSV